MTHTAWSLIAEVERFTYDKYLIGAYRLFTDNGEWLETRLVQTGDHCRIDALAVALKGGF